MYELLTVLIVLVCLLIMVVVLIQNPKGGGLGAGFGGGSAQMLGGVKQTTDFLDRATWYLALALFVLSIFSTAFIDTTDNSPQQENTKIEDLINNE